MKRMLVGLFAALVAAFVVAGPVPQQRTRIINQTAGTNQLLSTWLVTSFAYTNELIDVVAVGHSATVPFLRVGDDVYVSGYGTTGTNGIDGWYRVYGLYDAHVQLFRGAYTTTNTGVSASGYLTFDQPFTSLSFIGQKAPGTNNVGVVRIGLATNAVGPLTLGSNEVISVKAEVDSLSLTNWSIYTTNNGDGVVVIYFPK